MGRPATTPASRGARAVSYFPGGGGGGGPPPPHAGFAGRPGGVAQAEAIDQVVAVGKEYGALQRPLLRGGQPDA
jgi:hypothetical protein